MKAMDSQRNKNWPKLLPDIVKAINSTENNQEKFEANMKNIQVGDWILANQPQKKDWKKDTRERYFYFFSITLLSKTTSMIQKTRQLFFQTKRTRRGVISKANNKNSYFQSDFFMLPKNYGRLYHRLIIFFLLEYQPRTRLYHRLIIKFLLLEYEARISYISL